MLEWGPVGIPDNPYAVAKVLDVGRLDGRPIEEPLLRMLKSFAPPLRVYTKGFDAMPSEVQKTAAELEAETKAAQAAADAKAAKQMDDSITASAKASDGQGEKEEDGDNDQPIPQGSKALAGMHKALGSCERKCRKAASMIEHPECKEYLGGLADSLAGHVAEIKECHSKCYKGMAELGESADTEPDGDADDKSLTKFFADGDNARLQLTGLASRLKSLSSAANLNASQKSVVEAVSGRLEKLLAESREKAKSSKVSQDAASGPDYSEMLKVLGEVKESFGAVSKALSDAIPKNRK